MPDFFLSIDAILQSPVKKFELGIGECFFTNVPMLIRTVLGSCVCATFYHAPSHFVGAFHAVMPEAGINTGTQSCKYVDTAIASMAGRFEEQAIPFDEIIVKIFGGTNKFSETDQTSVQKLLDVGMKNVTSAKAHLKSYGFRLRAQDVRGDVGRTLYFHTSTGDVWVKKHKTTHSNILVASSEEDTFHQLHMAKDLCRYVHTGS